MKYLKNLNKNLVGQRMKVFYRLNIKHGDLSYRTFIYIV